MIEKIFNYKADVFDVGLTKIAVFAITLLLAKLWEPLLSLEWYWYLIIMLLAVVRPFVTIIKWLKS